MRGRLLPRWPDAARVVCVAGILSVVGCGHASTTPDGSTGGRAQPSDTAQPARIEAQTTTANTPASTATAKAAARAKLPSRTASSVPAPRIEQRPIPFPASRRREMIAYARRHYGIDTFRLIDPRVIVEHYTETPNFRSTYETFAPDYPDSELHELPNTCAHFVVDRAGVIYQLVPVTIMCRHTVGLNYTAIGIENVGYSDREILDDSAEMRASLALTRWLRCEHGISIANVIGHNESLSSRYHHENIASLRTQTHEDWRRADMDAYRARLRRLTCGSPAGG